jgi:hypothetical protein
MSRPKALLCLLGDGSGAAEENGLREAGFLVSTVRWKHFDAAPRGWMRLLPLLRDEGADAWILAGRHEDFTSVVLARAALLTLGLPSPPVTAFVVCDGGETTVPGGFLEHVTVFRGGPFAGRVMAERFRPKAAVPRPCRVFAHLDERLGLWLEVGPGAGEVWDGFMLGVVAAEISAFGVGPCGTPPARTVLEYPLLGIRGDIRGEVYCGCAARNVLGHGEACFLRVEGDLFGLFVAGYPTEGGMDARHVFSVGSPEFGASESEAAVPCER